MPVVIITRNYQITIPKQIREKLGLKEGDKVEIYQEGDRIVIKKLEKRELEELRDFLPENFDEILSRIRGSTMNRLKRLDVL